MRIELTSIAWEAIVLPLNYTRMKIINNIKINVINDLGY